MLLDDSGRELKMDRIEDDVERQFIVIHLLENLVKDSIYLLSMSFTGRLNDQQRGFFRMTYQEDGVKKYILFLYKAAFSST